eukprot:12790-Eustigmatos_ZCMA.PRE.1
MHAHETHTTAHTKRTLSIPQQRSHVRGVGRLEKCARNPRTIPRRVAEEAAAQHKEGDGVHSVIEPTPTCANLQIAASQFVEGCYA